MFLYNGYCDARKLARRRTLIAIQHGHDGFFVGNRQLATTSNYWRFIPYGRTFSDLASLSPLNMTMAQSQPSPTVASNFLAIGRLETAFAKFDCGILC